MKNVIITTPVRGVSKGIVSDTNSVEFPPDTAEDAVNVIVTPDSITARRPGLTYDTAVKSNTAPDITVIRSFFWEPASGVTKLIEISSDFDVYVSGVKVVDLFLLLGTTPNRTQPVVTYEKEVPTGAPRAASTASEFFNSASHELCTVHESWAGGGSPFVLEHRYTNGGNTYVRKTAVSFPGTTTLPGGIADYTSLFSFSATRNFVVITGGWSAPIVLWYGPDGSVRWDLVSIGYRRYEDLPDGIGITEQPSSAVSNANLALNLQNRGWSGTDITTYQGLAPNLWPSKAMVPWKGKNTSGVFTPAELNKVYFNTSSAPTGSLVLKMERDRTTNPSTSCAMGSRIWYAGFLGTDSSQYVAYSQIITSKQFMGNDCGSCYAYNDPTAEFLNQPTAIDGGLIKVEGAKDIKRLLPFKDGVLVFAENGVWAITGISGQAFQGNAFNLYKITDDGAVSGSGVVEAGEQVMYVTVRGINAIVANTQTRSLDSVSMTEGVIGEYTTALLKSFTNTITETSNALGITRTRNSTGVFAVRDAVAQKVYFMFGQASIKIFMDLTGITPQMMIYQDPSFTYNALLEFDLQHGAFFKHEVNNAGGKKITHLSRDWTKRAVIYRKALPMLFLADGAHATPYKDITDYTYSAGAMGSFVTADYSSYIVISSKNALVDPDKQIHVVNCTFENSNYGTYPSNVDGACKLSVIYDNHSGPSTVRTSPEQDAYRHVPGREPDYATGNIYRTVQTRLKLRGHGKHFRVKLRSVGAQNFRLVGYSLDVSYPYTELKRISNAGE